MGVLDAGSAFLAACWRSLPHSSDAVGLRRFSLLRGEWAIAPHLSALRLLAVPVSIRLGLRAFVVFRISRSVKSIIQSV